MDDKKYKCGNCGKLIDVVDIVSWVYTKDGTKRFCSIECKENWLSKYLEIEVESSTLDESNVDVYAG